MLPLAALADAAELDALVGRRLTDVRCWPADAPVGDLAVLGLVETRVGEPLVMADVRQTIDHLVTLGRYADIRVFGEADGEGVRLRYGLVPLDRIVRVRFDGRGWTSTPTSCVRRWTSSSTPRRWPAGATTWRRALEARYQARGYAQARVDLRLSPAGRPGEVEAVVTATPGPRTVVGRVTTEGDATDDLVARLDLAPGRPLDRETLDARVQAATDGFRDERYYEAVVTTTVDEASPGVADVHGAGHPGRSRSSVEFTGDQLPASRRRSLVPIEQLRSVDEEVIEDASRNIEQYLRLEGYRLAEAPAVRRRDAGAAHHHLQRSPRPAARAGVAGRRRRGPDPAEEVEGLLKLQAGEALRRRPRRHRRRRAGRAVPGARLRRRAGQPAGHDRRTGRGARPGPRPARGRRGPAHRPSPR